MTANIKKSKSFILIASILGFFAFIFIGAIIFGLVMWSQHSHAVGLEERVQAQYVSNKSNYDNMWKRFVEMTQVTEIQSTQIKETFEGLITGRYQDPQLLFKMVQEDNPQLDGAVYTQLQREISAGRIQFDNNQKAIADQIREYNTYIRRNFVMAAITNRETMDANKFIVTSDKTENAFNVGKDETINLTGK